MKVKKIGFPVIHNYPGDIREFTPDLFRYLNKFSSLELYLEDGYGSRLGYSNMDYLEANPNIIFTTFEDVFKKDMLISLKMPELKALEYLREDSSLFTMIHYDTRPAYVKLLKRKNIKSFAMDMIVDDNGLRIFVDYFGTAFAGCEIAFNVLKESMKDFYSLNRDPIMVTVIGAGGVGSGCVKSFQILGDNEFSGSDTQGLITQVITSNITKKKDALVEVFKKTNILIDASKRADYTKKIISNDLLEYLPQDAVILDLSADRYDLSSNPPLVRAVEGTVKGTPSHNIIYTDDKIYDELPDFVNKSNRRIVVSSDAWPSAKPHESIKYYEILMKNYLNVLLSKDLNEITIESDNVFERALHRSTIEYFLKK